MRSTAHRSLVAATLLLLAACGGTPQRDPELRPDPVQDLPLIGMPGSETEAAAEFDPLLTPVRDALAANDWMAAQLALPRPATGERLDGDLEAWVDYFRARIALLRGDLDAHD